MSFTSRHSLSFLYPLLCLVTLFWMPSALACSNIKWTGGASGAVAVNDPDNGVPSVSGACGFQVTGMGHVQDDSPDNESSIYIRFYFFPVVEVTGALLTPILQAYDNDDFIDVFTIGFTGTSISFDGTSTGGNFATVPLTPSGWHLIEVYWENGGTGSLWVDSDATQDPPDATFLAGNGGIQTIRLGAPDGFVNFSGVLFFDDYLSTRITPIGPILAGDTNLDDVIDADDLEAIKNRFLFGTYTEGSSDCNLDGGTNSGDVNCVVEEL